MAGSQIPGSVCCICPPPRVGVDRSSVTGCMGACEKQAGGLGATAVEPFPARRPPPCP